MPRPDPLSPNAQGALWLLASVAGATAMTVAVRLLSPELHTSMLAFLRSAFAAVLVLPFLVRARLSGGAPIRFSRWPLHLLRGLLIGVALNSGFYAIAHLELATSTILFFLAPAFATAFAALFMGEPVGLRRWGAIAAGLLGAVVILRPGIAAFDPVMAIAILSALAFAAALIIGRQIGSVDGSDAVFVSSSIVVVAATLPPALFVWGLPQGGLAWAILAVLVLGSAVRTYSDIRAYAVGDAGFIAPFTYLRLITVGLAGWLLFGETIDGWTAAGGAIIIGATLYISLRETRLRRRVARGAAAP
ncbi:DMT family transporter [Paralimibaculum aggregatum]|uniref:DMT family transporter n=1 Tax=Paralimibaculum aggregatum TaxID=3036245 RepID=A0ABQ6LGN3_9RHOB|nr:DMT family transporter [Limibaculum sp. NKW23]GMG82473.1 DMT family transporter [Limibaculum sp. NKW23]